MPVALTHEYWIEANGTIRPDNERNHAAMAAKHMIGVLYGYRKYDPMLDRLLWFVGANDWDDDVIGFREALLNSSDMLSRDPKYAELADDYEDCMLRAGVPQHLLDGLFNRDNDPRDWVVRHAGWICVKGSRIAVPGHTDKVARLLRSGLWSILEFEGRPGFDDSEEFALYDLPHELRYAAEWSAVAEGVASAWQRSGFWTGSVATW